MGSWHFKTNKLQKRTCHLKTGKMFFSPVSSIDKDLKIFIVVDDKFVVHSRNSVAKHRAIVFAITWFHPWTYRQLGQTWHAPDVDIVINYRGWKFESVICNKEKSLTGKPKVISKERIYRAFSLTWATSMLMYRNKRKRWQKTRDQLPQNWLGILTRPQFHCFGTPIWPPWRHVKTLYINKATFPPSPKLTYILQNCFWIISKLYKAIALHLWKLKSLLVLKSATAPFFFFLPFLFFFIFFLLPILVVVRIRPVSLLGIGKRG